ncbi:SGNH/GDSL hydrolase family protein [Pseudorhodobacter ferrugineus]|uniref:SGNH/GDSL hydrolase family protein n=1 Tax=Pseudorhodobacter ferrugineus TaxID=77008 RepID=UPI0003B6B239|nr:SGNH/GDSL hydrolase family protein [Pseudorhodobacter ferrugineus]
MFNRICVVASFSVLLACGETVTPDTRARVLLLGDSMMASNSIQNQTVADGIESILREEVIDRSVPAARYFYILPISGAAGLRLDAQYRPGPWKWVVLNGGGNDLLFGGGCGTSTTQLDRLVSHDGKRGAIPDFVAKLRASGARVLYVGYLRNPGFTSPIKACGPAGNEMDKRLATMAALDKGVDFMALSDLVPHGDTSYHQFDRIHPSPKGSRAIAARIAQHIKR